MPTRFVCLANSFKEGGRCLAGIELDKNNNPIIANGRLKWVRPICNTPHGEVPTDLVAHIEVLDIIEIEVTGYPDKEDYQSENALFFYSLFEKLFSLNFKISLLEMSIEIRLKYAADIRLV